MFEYLFCLWAGGYIGFTGLAFCVCDAEQAPDWDWFAVLLLFFVGLFWPIVLVHQAVSNRFG